MPKRRPNKRPGPARTRSDAVVSSSGESSPKQRWIWLSGLVTAAVTALVVALVTGFPGQIIDLPKAKDKLRTGDLSGLGDVLRDGDALRVTVNRMSNLSGSWDAAFPASALPAAVPFLRTRPMPDDVWSFLESEFDAGGFSVGGLFVQLELEGKLSQEITVFDVRPVLRREEIPTAAAVFLPSQGDAARQMYFDLDRPAPGPEKLDRGVPAGQFFHTERIGLPEGHKESLSLSFDTSRAAYSFTIALHYEVGGEKFVQYVDRAGTPFRVAPAPCKGRQAFPGRDVTVEDTRYDKVFLADIGRGDFTVRPVPPERICSS